MKNLIRNTMLIASLLAFHLPSPAEDTDLFVGVPPSATDLPNVLIVLDNTANWNTAFTNEQAALIAVVNGLPVNKFRVGLMMFTETGSGNSGEDGGYVRAAVRTLDTAATKTKYANLVSGIDKVADKSNGGKLGKTMTDAYQYFAGGAPYTGNNKVKTDYTGNASGSASSNAIYALSNNALSSKAGSPYTSPIVSGSCARNYIIYISNGAAQDNTSDTTKATTQLTAAAAAAGIAGATTALSISPSGSATNVGDEWARFMKRSDLGIVTYTVDVDKVTSGQGPGWTALLKSMATVSSGKYFDVSSSTGAGSQISDALNTIFSEIQSVNSVFASVSLPVSVNTQGTYLNQVYVGMFRPDGDGFPRWFGNLKQYKLGLIGSDLKLQDADSSSAVNSQTGFITECARSYWTPTTWDNYWAFRPQGACLVGGDSTASNSPDGNIVDKGAQAYTRRTTTTRTVKTCSSVFASCTALTDFNNTNVTQAMLGASSTTERDNLINWAKGQDIQDENIDGLTTTAMRPSVHGDVVHSRPAAINYGTDAAPQVVVFYGANDGGLRAINGNRTASITSGGTYTAGQEMWTFIPPEFYTNIKRIYDNTTQISFLGNTTVAPVPLPKPYGMDGPVTVYKNGGTAYAFATMRRGGRVLYGFDVSTPGTPTLKWKKGCPNNFSSAGVVSDTSCAADYTGIGQTWAAPKIMFASAYGAGTSPILIMGGGYDTCEDSDPNNCTAANKGNKIYVLDADTGAQLAALSTARSVVADMVIAPDSITGFAKYGYIADMGGNIYRINIGSAAPSAWTITKIASLGCDSTASCGSNRKFMFGMSVVEVNGTYHVMLGSGDREKPLSGYASAYAVNNYFFMVKDKPDDAAWLSSESTNCGSAVICKNSLLGITTSADPLQADLDAKKGWYLGLGSGEQVVTAAITVFGTTTFSTHTPATATPGVCTANLGTARVYNIAFTNATPKNDTDVRYETISGGGLPPSPVAGKVTLDNGTTVAFCIGCEADSPLESTLPTNSSSAYQPKARVYWNIER